MCAYLQPLKSKKVKEKEGVCKLLRNEKENYENLPNEIS